jgi:hypothetical protein
MHWLCIIFNLLGKTAYFPVDLAKKEFVYIIMGGYGSTRWWFHDKKTQVEDCRKLTIFVLKPYIRPGWFGSARWYSGGYEYGSADIRVLGKHEPIAILLRHKLTSWMREGEVTTSIIHLTTTPLPWGGVRYWFTCPVKGCGKRVGCLYLPPGYLYFACRHCYDLTYRSCQEQNSLLNRWKHIAANIQDLYPGITWKETKQVMEYGDYSVLWPWVKQRHMRELDDHDYDAHHNYLTADEICQKSGLSHNDIEDLEEARILMPDTKDRLYRPKLASWARKLSYLLDEGWETLEIKAWVKGRWSTSDPRHWPPDRSHWKSAQL